MRTAPVGEKPGHRGRLLALWTGTLGTGQAGIFPLLCGDSSQGKALGRTGPRLPGPLGARTHGDLAGFQPLGHGNNVSSIPSLKSVRRAVD